jgi:hypothetical protein
VLLAGAVRENYYNFSAYFSRKYIYAAHAHALAKPALYGGRWRRLKPPGRCPQESPMSLSLAETILRNARDQHAQQDINASMLKALSELTNELKRLDDEVRRVRRDVQVGRRF